MALRASSITAQLSKLSLRISQTGVRYASTNAQSQSSTAETSTPDVKEKHQAPEDHGELIWVFRHIQDNMTIYSLKAPFKANTSMKQLPFTGKKLKPAKFRRDYWKPLAAIHFPKGQGQVGLSVYHMMIQAKFMHQFAWDPNTLQQSADGSPMSKKERGQTLNAQLKNTVADMAAVLAGAGKGNKIWVDSATSPGTEDANAASVPALEDGAPGARVKTNIFWIDPAEKHYAKGWSDNITHWQMSKKNFADAGAPVDNGSLLAVGI